MELEARMLLSSLASALSALLTPAATDALGFPVNIKKRAHRRAAKAAVAVPRPARFIRPEREACHFGERKPGRAYAFGG